MDTTEATVVETPAASSRSSRSFLRHWPWVLGISLVVIGLLGLDRTIYQIVSKSATPTRLEDLNGPGHLLREVVRFPASIYGGLAVFFLILVVHPARWQRTVAAVVACLSADLTGSLLKMVVARARPDHAGPNTHLVFHPFHGFARDAAVSFPSGEATAAFALATAVTLMYPRLRWPCYLLAAGVCAARLTSGAHYLSDVAAGAMIGTLVTRTLFPLLEPRLQAILRGRQN
jgi:membrane-associated phospholipid phosphatase